MISGGVFFCLKENVSAIAKLGESKAYREYDLMKWLERKGNQYAKNAA
jgi:hypothetical protein